MSAPTAGSLAGSPVPDVFGLRGRNALVVGGGQGMGESTCRLLAAVGCNVAILDVDGDRAATLAAQFTDVKAVPVTVDVLSDDGAAGAVREARARLGALDVLVTVVGQARYVPLIEMSHDDWDLDHRRNLRYFFLMAQAFAQAAIEAQAPANIVAIASVSGIQSAPKHASYGAAKAGVINLVKSMAVEWAPHAIRVNAVAPGSIVTPRRPDSPERQAEIAGSLIPMKRRGSCDDIAKAVLYLASDMSPYVTGQTLAVDGGWTAASMYRR